VVVDDACLSNACVCHMSRVHVYALMVMFLFPSQDEAQRLVDEAIKALTPYGDKVRSQVGLFVCTAYCIY
jgi:hypothetical protein